jgi:hypothetical protein
LLHFGEFDDVQPLSRRPFAFRDDRLGAPDQEPAAESRDGGSGQPLSIAAMLARVDEKVQNPTDSSRSVASRGIPEVNRATPTQIEFETMDQSAAPEF